MLVPAEELDVGCATAHRPTVAQLLPVNPTADPPMCSPTCVGSSSRGNGGTVARFAGSAVLRWRVESLPPPSASAVPPGPVDMEARVVETSSGLGN
jgi:hypothetical protein